MSILKIIFYVIIGLIALILLLGLFVKKEYAVEREIIINKPKMDVYNYVKVLRNQTSFSTWEQLDANLKREYHGEDGAVGSVFRWEGNSQAGVGEQEITALTEGSRIDIELRFIKPFPSISPSYFTTESVSDTQTKVKWGMAGVMNYPMNVMQLVVSMDKMIGTQYENSLKNLKQVLEKS